ncbi:MAG: NAD(P)-binding domain-containing protein, partial [Bauldia sp.]
MNDPIARTEAGRLASRWIADFGAALARRDVGGVVSLFDADCYWRDLISFTWNIATFEGLSDIAAMLQATLDSAAPANLKIEGEPDSRDGVIEAWFVFETAVALGRGHLRLKGDKCWTLLTTMTELKGHEERKGERREKGVEHGARHNRKSWLERKNETEAALGISEDPYCVIIGGGQGGIALGARLRRLGVPTIILEKNQRPGDSWRNRYKSLVLHDPVWYDHLPYLPFPEHWPVFTPKDQLGDWLEMYTRIMELNYWGSSECRRARFDPNTGHWVLTVNRDGREVTLRCRQLIFATGAYGPPNETRLPGAETFLGE